MKKKFEGNLKYINPRFLVTEDQNKKIESFFIGLGVIFNDLKDILLFEELLLENYEGLENKSTDHDGNYGGVLTYIQKLLAGTISEFFIFLRKNEQTFSTLEFRILLDKLPKNDRELWDSLVSAANGEWRPVEKLLKAIVFVRSNVAFHFDQSGKILRNAFISRFFGREKGEKTKYAYYSIGGNMKLTRFYFSDAAVEEAIFLAAGKKFKANSFNDISIKNFRSQIIDTINVMNSTIASLLKVYLQSQRNLPR